MIHESLPAPRTTRASEPVEAQHGGHEQASPTASFLSSPAADAPYSGIGFLRTSHPTARHPAPLQAKGLLRDSHLQAPTRTIKDRRGSSVSQLHLAPGRVIQMDTSISHTTSTVKVSGKDFTVGVAMNALLDPDDAVKGSATGPNWDWMKVLRGTYPKAGVVRGHLLNHDLGGYAVPENLYPISTKANADHSANVEQNVKAALSAADAVTGGSKPIIPYNVTVKEGANAPETAAFLCDWKDESGSAHKYVVKSELKKDAGGWGGKGGNVSPVAWQHGKRRGAQEWATMIAAASPKITITGAAATAMTETEESRRIQAVLAAFDIDEDLDDIETLFEAIGGSKPEDVMKALEMLGYTVKAKTTTTLRSGTEIDNVDM